VGALTETESRFQDTKFRDRFRRVDGGPGGSSVASRRRRRLRRRRYSSDTRGVLMVLAATSRKGRHSRDAIRSPRVLHEGAAVVWVRIGRYPSRRMLRRFEIELSGTSQRSREETLVEIV
jgi:hypothetical protein